MNKLTGTEKNFLAAMLTNLEASPEFNFNNPHYWPGLQHIIRKTAYHVAGHFAARCFTMLELPRMVSISIMPEQGKIGSLNYERSFNIDLLESFPPSFQCRYGRMLMLEYLAGTGAEIIIGLSEGFQYLSYYRGKNNLYFDRNAMTDHSNAVHTAFKTKLFMPPNKNFQVLKKWTLEMLRIPAVWNIVETMADKLIEQRTIMHDDIYKIIADLDCPCIFDLPKWRRRLSINK
ncbi:MAG: hypothetical protein ABFD75_02730 [Smithella sp.]